MLQGEHRRLEPVDSLRKVRVLLVVGAAQGDHGLVDRVGVTRESELQLLLHTIGPFDPAPALAAPPEIRELAPAIAAAPEVGELAPAIAEVEPPHRRTMPTMVGYVRLPDNMPCWIPARPMAITAGDCPSSRR